MNKARIAKSIRSTLLSVGILLVLSVVAGIGYTWYMGQSGNISSSAIAEPVEAAPAPILKHVQPAANAKVGASVQMITSPVTPGSNTSISIKTNPSSVCTITVVYDKVASTDSGLKSQIADEFGMVSWTWTVGPSVPLGKWPVTVTCVNGKQSAVVVGDLQVAKIAN